jgi:RNA polymerase sigma-70 factor (ECF subfamily)
MTEPSELTDLRNTRRFNEAYRQFAPLAFTAANRVLRDAAAAEDVVQDVFMQLWLRPSAFDPARGALSRYVTLLARSRAMDRWRSRSARDAAIERSAQESLLRPHAHESAAEPVIRRERANRVLRALDGLPSDQREAVLLAYGRGLTAQEIARAAQVPLGTAKSRVRLGLEKAREGLAAPPDRPARPEHPSRGRAHRRVDGDPPKVGDATTSLIPSAGRAGTDATRGSNASASLAWSATAPPGSPSRRPSRGTAPATNNSPPLTSSATPIMANGTTAPLCQLLRREP